MRKSSYEPIEIIIIGVIVLYFSFSGDVVIGASIIIVHGFFRRLVSVVQEWFSGGS